MPKKRVLYQKKKGGPALRVALWLLGVILLAALVYGLTLADYVFPGESARLVTQWTGMDALAFPEHPIWGRLVSLMAGLSFTASTALRINLVSFVSGLLATGLICWLTA